jgi:hypothetical protein
MYDFVMMTSLEERWTCTVHGGSPVGDNRDIMMAIGIILKYTWDL